MLATETGSVHTELLEKGFSIPVYTYTPFESAGCPSPWWEVTAELQSSIGVLTCKATAPSKKAAKSEVSTLLLARAHAMMPPAQHEIKMRPGFLSPKPIAAFTSGEAKDAKALVRKYGFDFVEAAVKHYLSAGTSDPQDDATPKSASPKSDSSTQTEVRVRSLRRCRWCEHHTYAGKGVCHNLDCIGASPPRKGPVRFARSDFESCERAPPPPSLPLRRSDSSVVC